MTASEAVRRYFERWYPHRGSWLSGRLVRRGEAELAEVIVRWMPQSDGFTLLDAGCGDGGFLATVLLATPSLLRLEDLCAGNVDTARRTSCGSRPASSGREPRLSGRRRRAVRRDTRHRDARLSFRLAHRSRWAHRAYTSNAHFRRTSIRCSAPRGAAYLVANSRHRASDLFQSKTFSVS